MKTKTQFLATLILVILSLSFSPPPPVELGFFGAGVVENDVILGWTTFTETNNEGFHIERKIVSSSNWTDVGFVAGHGTTSTPQTYVYADTGLSNGSYNYRLRQVDFNGDSTYFDLNQVVIVNSIAISNSNNFIPGEVTLYQNYPNPFNPKTIINYQLQRTNFVSLKVYDILGNEVATLVNQKQNAGSYSVEFDGSIFTSGEYFYEFKTDNFGEVKKMLLIK